MNKLIADQLRQRQGGVLKKEQLLGTAKDMKSHDYLRHGEKK